MRPMLEVLANKNLPFKVARYVRSGRAKLVTRLRKPWKAKGLCRTRLPSTIRKVASIMFWPPSILAKQPRTIQLEPTLFKLNSGGGRAPSKQQHRATRLEPISKSSEEDNEAGELYKAEEVLSVILPADEDATLPLYPGEEALDEPAPRVTA